jgi:hypothetical protein
MKKFFTTLLCLILFASSSLAWNRAGHMVSGAIAYSELKTNHPNTLKKVMALLQQHPDYQAKWEEAIKDLPDKTENHDLYIFMMAARWADDIRDSPSFNHPKWHYINYPLTFESGIATRESDPENIVSAFTQNYANLTKSNIADTEKAVSLTWIFHLTGDVHQPLHATALFSSEFPNGDKGGNDFKIMPEEGAKIINLHSFWDGIIIGSDNFQQVKNEAIRIRNNANLQRKNLAELKDPDFTNWAKKESFNLAHDVSYDKGALKSGSTLTQAYRDKAKEAGERRMVLAGYRLADLLSKSFEIPGNLSGNAPVTASTAHTQNSDARIYGNKNSKIYHLSNCPDYSKISPQNRVPFHSEEEAQKSGYRKAKNCP